LRVVAQRQRPLRVKMPMMMMMMMMMITSELTWNEFPHQRHHAFPIRLYFYAWGQHMMDMNQISGMTWRPKAKSTGHHLPCHNQWTAKTKLWRRTKRQANGWHHDLFLSGAALWQSDVDYCLRSPCPPFVG
jgi:hypothetical protein